MRLYVSGPITGMPDLNFPAFNEAAKLLSDAGFWPVNPAGIIEGYEWEDYMRDDLRMLLECDGVALLPGWEDSRGAALEVHVAESLGMPVRLVTEWMKK